MRPISTIPDAKAVVQVAFPHGLGDCTMFAHQIPLYIRRGIQVEVACNADKHILFAGTGARVVSMRHDFPKFKWEHPPSPIPTLDKSLACYNKAAWNLSVNPMPNIGAPEELWSEYCAQRVDVCSLLTDSVWRKVSTFLHPLPRPVILLHTIGNSFQTAKSLPQELTARLYRELLDQTTGTLILLDWDNRVPRLNHYRVRHLTDDLGHIDVEHLLALIDRSDLIIGIDSGPLHAARYTDTPALGIFWNMAHHPARYCLPHDKLSCVVPETILASLSEHARLEHHILTSPENSVEASFIAHHARRMLQPPRYLKPVHRSADIQLQQMVRDWSRGEGNEVSQRVDRDIGWDVILREISSRFERPVIVETGCVRSRGDWRGAGNSTVLLGEYAHHKGGTLTSIDISEENCCLAREVTRSISCVNVVCGDSTALLTSFSGKIDFLYLDSLDTFVTGSAEHALREFEAALPHLHELSIVAIDDTAYSKRGYSGKGTLLVPHLLNHGWRLLFSGYQTALVRL